MAKTKVAKPKTTKKKGKPVKKDEPKFANVVMYCVDCDTVMVLRGDTRKGKDGEGLLDIKEGDICPECSIGSLEVLHPSKLIVSLPPSELSQILEA